MPLSKIDIGIPHYRLSRIFHEVPRPIHCFCEIQRCTEEEGASRGGEEKEAGGEGEGGCQAGERCEEEQWFAKFSFGRKFDLWTIFSASGRLRGVRSADTRIFHEKVLFLISSFFFLWKILSFSPDASLPLVRPKQPTKSSKTLWINTHQGPTKPEVVLEDDTLHSYFNLSNIDADMMACLAVEAKSGKAFETIRNKRQRVS